jgi:outer membrane immunogenic protein
MRYPRLSPLFVAVSAVTLLAASTVSFAGHAHPYHHKTVAVQDFKGEANYKAECPPPCPPVYILHDGFYVGAGVGYDAYRFHHSSTFSIVDTVDPTNDFSATTSLNHSATGWMGGIFAGYGRYFDWFYLGAEINANASNADTTWSVTNTDDEFFRSKLRARTSYGIALLPGIKLSDSSLFYARVGYLRTDFKVSELETNVIDPELVTSRSNSDWKNGFNYGVGIETYVAENVSLRGEFTHTTYKSSKATSTFVDDTGTVTLTGTSKVEPSNNEFMLSLLYHFC